MEVRFEVSDAEKWMQKQQRLVSAVFTSPPDAEEIGADISEWAEYYRRVVAAAIRLVCADGYTIIYCTDRRHDKHIASKAGIVLRAAEDVGVRVLWHKICYQTLGTSLFRPSYSHLIAMSVNGTAGRATPDVFPDGKRVYKNAAGGNACDVAIEFLRARGVTSLVDMFCGRGSIAWRAALHGVDSVNVDIDEDQVDAAISLFRRGGAEVGKG